MASCAGFIGNSFHNRSDLISATKGLLVPVEQYRSLTGARIKFRPPTVAAFDDNAAQLEGFSRPLLGIAAFLDKGEDSEKYLERWMRGLAAGVDPQNHEYWGDIGDFDQRIVETESICLAFLAASEQLLPYLDEPARANTINWLRQVNGKQMPKNNWRWFRIFVNLTLIQVFQLPEEELKPQMTADFEVLDSFCLGHGWSSDGDWGEERRQADYYSGSFAMQFAQLLYVRFANGNEDRKGGYIQQAREFGADYWRYFDVNGAAIPFGRSILYRFAMGAFWAAAALADVELPAPVHKPGIVKGLLLRHLRWWATKQDIFNSDGTLNVGFTYPNLYVTENYNSSQSVYWCLKSVLVMFLPESHRFWAEDEACHPLDDSSLVAKELQLCKALKAPRQVLNSTPEHHFLLSSGQMTTKSHKSKAAKYCKFAYSSAFGFSVPAGTTLEQMAPDSTICLSVDGGTTWVVRDCPSDGNFKSVLVNRKPVTSLMSTWKPYQHLDLTIETTLIPISAMYPGWHIRVHKVKWTEAAELAFHASHLQLVDGGFAVPAFSQNGYHIPMLSREAPETADYIFQSNLRCSMRSKLGICGVSHIELKGMDAFSSPNTVNKTPQKEAFVLKADPSTNVLSPRTFIPCLRFKIDSLTTQQTKVREAILVTGVFAVSPHASPVYMSLSCWSRCPQVVFTEGQGIEIMD